MEIGMTRIVPRPARKLFAAVAATFICAVGLGGGTAQAGGPWGRATGEAVELRRTTEDLRNRLERLFHGSPAAAWAVETDELAKQIKSATESHIGAAEFNALIDHFSAARSNTAVFVSSDPYIVGDERIRDYLEEVDERLERFVKDLSKAKPPVTSHYLPHAYAPQAYPGYHHDPHDHHLPAYAVPGYNRHSPSSHAPSVHSYGYRLPYSAGHEGGPNTYRPYGQPTYRGGIELRVPPVVVQPPHLIPGPRIAL